MTLRYVATSILLIIVGTSAQAQIVLGQLDTFQDGSLNSWQNNAGNISNIPAGGPGGATDRYMSIISDGGGMGGKLTAFNTTQWVGNYNTAGVTSIEMDFIVFSGSPLNMRISLNTSIDSSANGYVSTTAAVIPADGLWHHAVFLLNTASMTPITGSTAPPPLATVLAGPAELRIVQSLFPNTIHGNNIVASIGVDNIQATAVPEPGSLALGGVAIVLAFRTLRRRKAV